MRCLIISGELGTEGGGAARSSAELAAALSRRGINVTLAGPSATPINALEFLGNAYSAGVALEQLLATPSRHGGTALQNLVEEADVAIVSGAHSVYGDALATLCPSHNVPYIFSPRGSLDVSYLPFLPASERTKWQRSGRALFRGASAIHVTSQRERTGLSALEPRENWVCIPNAMNMDFLKSAPRPGKARAILGMQGDRTNWLSFGRIVGVKNLTFLIELLSTPQSGAAHLHLVGTADPDEAETLLQLAEKLNVSERVTLYEPAQGEERALWLQAADLHLIPSFSENFCRVLIEAMATGAPVMCSPHLGALEYGPFANVTVCDLDLATWQNALGNLPMAIAPQFDLVANHFDEEVVATKWIALLQDVLRMQPSLLHKPI